MSSLRYFAAFFGVLSALIVHGMLHKPAWRRDAAATVLWAAALAVSFLAAWALTDQFEPLAGLAIVLSLAAVGIRRMLPTATITGHGMVFSAIAIAFAVSSWTMELTASFGWPAWLQNTVLTLQAALFVYVFLLSTPFQVLSFGEFGLRQTRRDEALARIAAHPGTGLPKVCVQVPCYSEPPDLVIATLDAISKLDYPDFEVMVIDNNTKDPALWRPVEEHCRRLGERFRFFHVDPVSGAKAGALNWLAPHVSPDVRLIAVVDADYVVDPGFLRQWAPLFDDAQIGFVQTTHEYRDWEHSRFLSRFYPGYVCAHKLMFPALTEIGAEFTVGTMCMVRRSALEEVGGWAEWCQTEDSELAVRLHAKGYRGYYFADACGRGLIPETLDRMRKQRFRWAYGPMQQLRHHWRLYLGIAKDGKLTFKQRYFELAHSLEHTPAMAAALIHLPLWFGAYREIVQGIPTAVGWDYVAFLVAVIVKRRLSVFTNLQQVGRGTLIDFLLNPVVVAAIKVYEMKGSLSAMVGVRWPWQRTDKFPVTGSLRRALAITRVDMVLLAKCACAAALLLPYARFAPVNCVALLVVMFALGAAAFLVTIGLCLMHELELKAQHGQTGHGAVAVPLAGHQ